MIPEPLNDESLEIFLKRIDPITNNSPYVNFGYGYNQTDSDEVEFDFNSRLKTLSFLREQAKTNPILIGIFNAWVADIGIPKFKFTSASPEVNDALERKLEKILKTIFKGDSWINGWDILLNELALAGECIVILNDDSGGALTIVSAEFLGSPVKKEDRRKFETDGVIKDRLGYVKYLRIGKRLENGEISHEPKDSTVIPIENALHIRPFRKRAEGVRSNIPLMNSCKDIKRLDRITDKRIAAIDRQAGNAVFVKKENVSQEILNKAIEDKVLNTKAALALSIGNRSNIGVKADGEGVQVIYGKPGESIEHLTPALSDWANFDEFTISLINKIGMPFSISAEKLLGFYRNNYTSIGSSNINYNKHITKVRNCLKEALDLIIPFVMGKNGVILDDELTFESIFPPLVDINNDKASAVNAQNIENGTDSKTRIAMEKGLFIDEIIKNEIQEKIIRAKAIKQALKDNPDLTPEDLV